MVPCCGRREIFTDFSKWAFTHMSLEQTSMFPLPTPLPLQSEVSLCAWKKMLLSFSWFLHLNMMQRRGIPDLEEILLSLELCSQLMRRVVRFHAAREFHNGELVCLFKKTFWSNNNIYVFERLGNFKATITYVSEIFSFVHVSSSRYFK